MTTFSRLIAAAALISATTLAPRLAAADDDHERDEHGDRDARHPRGARHDRWEGSGRGEWSNRHVHDSRCMHTPFAPGWAVRDERRWSEPGRWGGRWERYDRGERFMLVRAVRHELSELERDRADFHAHNAYRPWLLARYDASYVERRAELERRLERITLIAWR